MCTEASYSYSATAGICKASSCTVGVAHECRSKNPGCGVRQSFVLATVSVTVSLGAKPAQAEGKCSIVQKLDTVAFLHTCFPCFQIHLAIFPTHSRWLKLPHKTELHLTVSLSVSVDVIQ